MWSPGQRKVGESITHHRVVVYKGSIPVQNESAPAEDAQTGFHLDKLESGIMYIVEVAGSNVAGFGRSTNTSFTTSPTGKIYVHVCCLRVMTLSECIYLTNINSHMNLVTCYFQNL